MGFFVAKSCDKATPNGCLVSGPGDFQIRMRAGGFSHYIIMIFM